MAFQSVTTNLESGERVAARAHHGESRELHWVSLSLAGNSLGTIWSPDPAYVDRLAEAINKAAQPAERIA